MYMQDTSPWMNLTTANKATELFNDAAVCVKDDPVLSVRVRRARAAAGPQLDPALQELQCWLDMTNVQFLGPNDPAIAVGEFIKTCNSFDAGQFREGTPFAGYEPALRGMFPPPGKKAKAPKESE